MDARERFAKYTDPETFAKIVDYGTVTRMWENSVKEYADEPALGYDGTYITYRELEDKAARVRAVLASKGLGKGSTVALISPNSPDLVTACIACVTLGCAALMMPPQLDEKTVFGCCMKYGAKALVYASVLAEKTAVLAKMAPQIPAMVMGEAGEEKLAAVEVDKKDPCVIMFTGGTSGRSKGALLSHGAVIQGTMNGCYGCKDVFRQRYILVLPLTHVFGLIRNMMTSLYTGSCMYICKNNQDMFRDIGFFRPTYLVAVPALAELALSLSARFGRNMLGPDMKTVICGAAAVPPYLLAEYAKIGINLFPGYGLTESANLVSGNPENVAKPDSVGLPYPNQELKIVDGELWIRGENLMEGYIGEEEDPWQDGWFKTGDLARIDEDGFLYITGRRKEIIVLANGENVSPAEVEAHFDALPFVMASQVFEDKDENGKHFLALEIVPRAAEVPKLGEDAGRKMMEKLAEVNTSLPSWQRVTRIEIRKEDFERTPSMKIKRYHKC